MAEDLWQQVLYKSLDKLCPDGQSGIIAVTALHSFQIELKARNITPEAALRFLDDPKKVSGHLAKIKELLDENLGSLSAEKDENFYVQNSRIKSSAIFEHIILATSKLETGLQEIADKLHESSSAKYIIGLALAIGVGDNAIYDRVFSRDAFQEYATIINSHLRKPHTQTQAPPQIELDIKPEIPALMQNDAYGLYDPVSGKTMLDLLLEGKAITLTTPSGSVNLELAPFESLKPSKRQEQTRFSSPHHAAHNFKRHVSHHHPS